MKILAISGSVRKQSYNTALLRSVRDLSKPPIQIEICNYLDAIPTFDPTLSDNQAPDSVKAFRSQLATSSALIICTPEYAHGIPGGLKNALDWVVDSAELVLKPVAVMSVSTSGLGGFRSHSALIHVLSAMNWNVVVEASVNVPFAKNRFNENLEIIDELTKRRLETSLAALTRAIEELQ
jgi:chromate reductase